MIQLLASDEFHVRTNFKNLADIIETKNLYLYRAFAHGKPALNVMWGSFETRQAAEESLKKLPRFLLPNKPYVRSAIAIRADLKRQDGS